MLDQEKFLTHTKYRKHLRILDFPGIRLRRFMEDYTETFTRDEKIADRLQDEISKVIDFHVHSIHNRCKDPEHLIERRSYGKLELKNVRNIKIINERNYLRIVRDLMGIRILILSKEEWRTVHDFC